ncbi:MAG: hypothetical protein SGARI_000141 [Bacillariaceae sp.]
MLETARNIVGKVTLLNSTEDASLGYSPKVVVGGRGVSGPTFVDNAAYREYVFEQFGAQCLDMESAAVAHIAYQHDVPFLFFRSLSDLAGGEADGNVLSTFFTIAAENAFTVLSAFIAELYPDVASEVDEDDTEAPTMAGTSSSAFHDSFSVIVAVVGVLVSLDEMS